MRRIIIAFTFLGVAIFAEILSYLAFRRIFKNSKRFNWIWWITTVLFYGIFIVSQKYAPNHLRNWLVNVFFIIVITKLFAGLTFVIAELIRLSRNIIQKPTPEMSVSRREFSGKIALGVASLPFVSMNWGIFKTAYNFRIDRETIKIPNLPKVFRGFKIVQISDIHTGSLQNHHQLQKAIDLILEQKADLICFTGDLVNNRTDEVEPYIEQLQQIRAPYGVFSTLGNHDYGDYEEWESVEAKEQNFNAMLKAHQKIGWRLLMDEHVSIEKDGDKFFLIGVQNWGASYHFPKYGNLKKAYEGVEKEVAKILLSHDPSHFDVEVSNDYKDIQLTLSGHTHGFQFGVEIPGYVKWSPAQYIYKRWAGLYAKGDQQIYVNRGLGCLGYMGRIGIRPEITVITLA